MGGENVLVHDFMVRHRDYRPWRTVKSVHNTPVERFWLDFRLQCLEPFLQVWTDLEATNDLNKDSDMDIFCVQFMFIPLLQVRCRL